MFRWLETMRVCHLCSAPWLGAGEHLSESYPQPEQNWNPRIQGPCGLPFSLLTPYFWFPCMTLESPLDCKEIQPVHPKRDQSWLFFGKTDAEAETPVLWPPHAMSWLFGKDSDAEDWGQEKKGMTEGEMAGWHHWLDGHESEWTLGDGDGQGGLVCCNSWDRKESDTTEWLNWTELNM